MKPLSLVNILAVAAHLRSSWNKKKAPWALSGLRGSVYYFLSAALVVLVFFAGASAAGASAAGASAAGASSTLRRMLLGLLTPMIVLMLSSLSLRPPAGGRGGSFLLAFRCGLLGAVRCDRLAVLVNDSHALRGAPAIVEAVNSCFLRCHYAHLISSWPASWLPASSARPAC